MAIRFGMVVLDVQDLQRSIDFYRFLGLAIPDPFEGRPVTVFTMDSGVSIVIGEGLGAANDPNWVRPEAGYQSLLEFFVADDAAVDAEWTRLTDAGHHGRRPPAKAFGPYAALVDDPDGNVVMITSEVSAKELEAGS